jgi:hypothetical protein
MVPDLQKIVIFEMTRFQMASAIEKALFVFSVALLAFLLGFLVRWHGWFPNALLERASQQATVLVETWSDDPAALNDRVYDRVGVRMSQPERVQPGFTLLTSAWPSDDGWTTGLRLIDSTGAVVHHWRVDKNALFPDSIDRRGNPALKTLHGTYLFPNGDVLVNVEYVGTARLDACGEMRWRLPEGTHHSIARAEDGSFWIPGMSRTPQTGSERHPDGFPGIDGLVWLDQLLRVSERGEAIDRINVLDLLYANGLERNIFKAYKPHRLPGVGKGVGKDVTHLNDIEPLSASMADEYPLFEAGDLLVSLRYLNLVFVVDPRTETVKWHTTSDLIQQHDPDFIGGGWVGIFDNNRDYSRRGTTLGGSRIVAVQPHTGSTEVRFPTAQSEPLYTGARGKWQQLPNGNMLLTESMAGRVVEVTPDGRTAWEWVQESYNGTQVPVVTKGTRYDLRKSEVAKWPCSPADTPTPNF